MVVTVVVVVQCSFITGICVDIGTNGCIVYICRPIIGTRGRSGLSRTNGSNGINV